MLEAYILQFKIHAHFHNVTFFEWFRILRAVKNSKPPAILSFDGENTSENILLALSNIREFLSMFSSHFLHNFYSKH